MTIEELQAIEQRLLGESRPIDVGDKVVIESFTGTDYVPYAYGTITKREDDAIWLDDNPTRYWLVDAHRDEPAPKDDIRTLLAEVNRLRLIEQRVVNSWLDSQPEQTKLSDEEWAQRKAATTLSRLFEGLLDYIPSK